jgi:monoamine oxidase
MGSFYDVVVVGAGAAGIAAGRRLAKAGVSFVLVEARERTGGRALTLAHELGALDLGCGWLHSGDRNVLTAIAEATGFELDRTPAPWQRQSGEQGISAEEQAAFRRAFSAFEARIDEQAERQAPVPASAYLEPDGRWNGLINAVFAYISGASLDCIDARDYARYEDDGVNWRVRQGYGALIAALSADLPVCLGAEALEIDHGASAVQIRTTRGDFEASAVILALPTSRYSLLRFTPDLPGKREAAVALPLGAAEKLYFALAQPEEFPVDGHLFPRTDTMEMGTYHLRPMGNPTIEAYFGASLARGLAEAGGEAMAAYAKEELANLLGSAFPSRLTTIASSSWSTDPFAMGAYSYAKPGYADMRAVLASPVEDRLFFAGEACSRARYSTAHGAYETGHDAAEKALAALAQRSMPTG